MKPPKRWKMAIMVWLAIYPTVTLIFTFFGKDLLQIHPLPLRTFFLTLVVVPLMVFVLIPFLQKILGNWLNK